MMTGMDEKLLQPSLVPPRPPEPFYGPYATMDRWIEHQNFAPSFAGDWIGELLDPFL